jgi:hypothetical protein
MRQTVALPRWSGEREALARRAGDTPMDLQASVEGGAQAVGVTTGVFTRADLEGCGAGALRRPPPAPPGCWDVLLADRALHPCRHAAAEPMAPNLAGSP